jgi:hypothetical protein
MCTQEQPKLGIGIGIFDKIFQEIFEYSYKFDKWVYHPEKIKKKHLALLLSWPGFVTFELIARTGEEALADKIRKSQKFLKDVAEKQDNTDTDNELFDLIKEVLNKLNFLTHPASFHYDHSQVKDLTFLISQYFIVCCIIANYIKGDEINVRNKFLSTDKIIEILGEFRIENTITDYFHLITFWWLTQSLHYSYACAEKLKIADIEYQYTIELTKKNFVLDVFLNNNLGHIAIITNGNFDHSNDADRFGFAVDLNTNPNLKDYISIFPVCFEGPKDNVDSIYDGYFFHKIFDIGGNIVEELLKYLNVLAKRISYIAYGIDDSLKNLIDSPDKIIQANIDNKFGFYIDEITKSGVSIKVLKDFHDLKRALLSCDENFFRKIPEYEKKRRKLSKSLQKTIGLERTAQLLEAAVEIDSYRDRVVRTFKSLEKKGKPIANLLEDYIKLEYKKFITDTKYLKRLKKNEILRIILRKEYKNYKRDSYRNVLPIINWYIDGAPKGVDTMHDSTLTKAIGLE